MKIKLIIVFLLMFPFVAHFSTTSSYACSCIQPGTTTEEKNRSDFVFSGKVIQIIDSNASSIVQSSADLLEIDFEVSETWKGVNETEVLLFTERDSASCGFNFEIDQEYLVYGNINDGEKAVSVCSKTTLLTNATEDLVALGEGQKPTEVVNLRVESEGFDHEEASEETSMTMLITIFTIVVLGIIFFSYFIVNKKIRR